MEVIFIAAMALISCVFLFSRIAFTPGKKEAFSLDLAYPAKRKFYTTFFFLFFFLSSVSGQTGVQTVIFNDLGVKRGKVYVALYNKEADFPKNDKIYIGKSVEVNELGSAIIIFENIAPGTYAIAAFLDKNGNGKMDTNFFGIPIEKYGFSNNVRPFMRAATFKEASFVVTNKNNTISIKLK